MPGREHGFTLIEVLIASVIMFTILTIGVTTYRTSLHLLDKTTKHSLISRSLPAIMEQVKQQIFSGKQQGKGVFSTDISYDWSSSAQLQSNNLLGTKDLDTGEYQSGIFVLVLHNVHLNINYGDEISGGGFSYNYKELTWKHR